MQSVKWVLYPEKEVVCTFDSSRYTYVRRTIIGLANIYGGLSAGGCIVVDDCDPHHTHCDGADQAYKEFMAEMNLATVVLFKKLGAVRKPS